MAAGVRAQKRAVARERILEAAGHALRVHGPDGVSVASVMADAGLTHGAFYSYFPSKAALIAEAMGYAGKDFMKRLEGSADGTQGFEKLERMAAAYLSLSHRANPSDGCQIAALGPELVRAGGPAAETLEGAVRHVLGKLEATLTEALGPSAERAEEAAADLATVVGGMVLARSLRDDKEAERLLLACRTELIHRAETRRSSAQVKPDPADRS